jgi:hypothetical protein
MKFMAAHGHGDDVKNMRMRHEKAPNSIPNFSYPTRM